MPSDLEKYLCEPQQRLIRLILTLSGNEVDGLTPGEIAKLQECSASAVTKDLANLKHLGWAEQTPTGRWRLGPDIVRVATRHMVALDRAERRLAEIKSRFGSTTAAAG